VCGDHEPHQPSRGRDGPRTPAGARAHANPLGAATGAGAEGGTSRAGQRGPDRRGHQAEAGQESHSEDGPFGPSGHQDGTAEQAAVHRPPQIAVAQHVTHRWPGGSDRKHLGDPAGGGGIAVQVDVAQVEPADGGGRHREWASGGHQAQRDPPTRSSPCPQGRADGDHGQNGGERHRAARPAGRRDRREHREREKDPWPRSPPDERGGGRKQPGDRRHRENVVVDLPRGGHHQPDHPDDACRAHGHPRAAGQQLTGEGGRRDDQSHPEQHVEHTRRPKPRRRPVERAAHPQRHRLGRVEQRRMVRGVDEVEVRQRPAEPDPAELLTVRVDHRPGLGRRCPAASRQAWHTGQLCAQRRVEPRQGAMTDRECVGGVLRLVRTGERRHDGGDEQPQRAEDQPRARHPDHHPAPHRRTPPHRHARPHRRPTPRRLRAPPRHTASRRSAGTRCRGADRCHVTGRRHAAGR